MDARLHGNVRVMREDFLTMASEQQMNARQQRDINLQVESPEGHRCVTTCKRMKSDFHAMHRSKHMKSIMQKYNAAAALVAPEQHHKMGKVERQLRRGHEAAGANLSENNLPAKYRYYATQAAIRAGDYLGTRANPEMLPPRSMRRLMEGETTPKIYIHETKNPFLGQSTKVHFPDL